VTGTHVGFLCRHGARVLCPDVGDGAGRMRTWSVGRDAGAGAGAASKHDVRPDVLALALSIDKFEVTCSSILSHQC
jgi:hypothetical protein